MLYISWNSCIKSKRNKKKSTKNNKIKPFINKYKWQKIHFSSGKDDWKKIKKNNVTIVLHVLYAKKENIHPNYVSKNDSNHEKQVILLMIPNKEGR